MSPQKAYVSLALVFLLVVALTVVAAHCDDRYGYPERRPRPHAYGGGYAYDSGAGFWVVQSGGPGSFFIAPLGGSPIYIAPTAPLRRDGHRRRVPSGCLMQGAFAVDWRKQCSPTK